MGASAILETHPTIDMSNLMLTKRDSSRHLDLMREVRKFLRPISKSLVNAHKCLLGRQGFCWAGSEFRFWVWDRPTYRLFINNQKGICIEVPHDATRDDAFDALEQYRQDIQMSGSLLSGSEAANLNSQGRDAIKGREREIHPYSDDDLRKFVLSYCDGKVWTDQDCRGNDVGMIFMPLAMGALSPPDNVVAEAEKNLPEHPGDEPDHPPRPTAPEEPEYPPTPDRPPEPEWFQEDPKKVADIQRKIRWQAANKADLDSYRELIGDKNRTLRESWDGTLATWEAECEQVWAQQEALERKHEAAMAHFEQNAEAEWKVECAKVDEVHTEWMRLKERYDTARQGLFAQYIKDLGIIWEYMDQALPRAVNGCPMFMSCRLMNRKDFGRAYDAIQRERERRESFKI